jgi:hypothetical protein
VIQIKPRVVLELHEDLDTLARQDQHHSGFAPHPIKQSSEPQLALTLPSTESGPAYPRRGSWQGQKSLLYETFPTLLLGETGSMHRTITATLEMISAPGVNLCVCLEQLSLIFMGK